MQELVRYEKEGAVAIITMDDGKANALGHAMIAAVNAALDRAQAEARAVVLAGRPGRFCAGFDLRVLTSGRDAALPLVEAGGALFLRLYGLGLPVVAACTGHALAGGALLLLVSDARIGTEGAYKLGLNEVAIGIPLPMLVRRLADDRLDPRRLVEATLLAGVYDPSTAREVGYLDEVVSEAEVRPRALERAHELARLPGRAFAASKASLRSAAIAQIQAALHDDVDRILQAGTSGAGP
jgi:enoyl-CoA hydratase